MGMGCLYGKSVKALSSCVNEEGIHILHLNYWVCYLPVYLAGRSVERPAPPRRAAARGIAPAPPARAAAPPRPPPLGEPMAGSLWYLVVMWLVI